MNVEPPVASCSSTSTKFGATTGTVPTQALSPPGDTVHKCRAPARATILKQENCRIAGDSCIGMCLKTPTKGHRN